MAGGGGGVIPTPPDTPNSPSPADNATNISLNPSITFAANGATSYTILFDVVNPPVAPTSLGGSAFYTPPTLNTLTTYYWQVVATNAAGTTTGPVWRFTTYNGIVTFNPHPRIFLDPTRKAELNARRVANTSEYIALKANADALTGGMDTTNSPLTSVLNIGDSTLTVTDGSLFPTGAFRIHIGQEVIDITSRSGNVMTIAARGVPTDTFPSFPTAIVSHPANAIVWIHATIDAVHLYTPYLCGMLLHSGATGYELVGRCGLAYSNLISGQINQPGQPYGNFDRWYWPYTIMGFDWLYASLTAYEKAQYAECIRAGVQQAIDGAYELGNAHHRQRAYETQLTNNIPSGGVLMGLMGAAATFGDNADAVTQWLTERAKVDSYVMPSILNGPASGGNGTEGDEYNCTSLAQLLNTFDLIQTATGEALWSGTTVSGWMQRVTQYFYAMNMPGSSASLTAATGTTTAGSNTITVAATLDFVVGDCIFPYAPVFNETHITAISGTTWTVADKMATSAAGVTIYHVPRGTGYGDNEHATVFWGSVLHYVNAPLTVEYIDIALHLMDRYRTLNPTYAKYLKFWADNLTSPYDEYWWSPKRFMYYDSTIVGVDPRISVFNSSWTSGAVNSVGYVISKSSWAHDAMMVTFVIGGEQSDHCHSDSNSLNIHRKGVWLLRNLEAYGGGGTEPKWESFPVSTKFHNTVFMDGNSGANDYSDTAGLGTYGLEPPLPNNFDRHDITTPYTYGRGDASGHYTPLNGYNPSTAQTFVRDLVHFKALDLVVTFDRLVYGSSATSHTTWNEIFREDPTLTAGTITLDATGGQSIVQKILLPASPVITKADLLAENALYAGWQVQYVSGVAATTEYGLSVFHCGDTGFTPLTTTLLSSTNSKVAQIGTYVCGFVPTATPTLNITYTYTGTPTHYIFGMAPSTAYHVVAAAGSAVISVATGSGDITSSAAGVLTF